MKLYTNTFYSLWLAYVAIELSQSMDNTNGSKRRLYPLSLKNCTADTDCKPNSVCHKKNSSMEGRCKCKEHYLLERNKTNSDYECLPSEFHKYFEKQF